MKTYIFKNCRTKELSQPVTAHSLTEAFETIGIGYTLFSISK